MHTEDLNYEVLIYFIHAYNMTIYITSILLMSIEMLFINLKANGYKIYS